VVESRHEGAVARVLVGLDEFEVLDAVEVNGELEVRDCCTMR
jgi:hypothetical protein